MSNSNDISRYLLSRIVHCALASKLHLSFDVATTGVSRLPLPTYPYICICIEGFQGCHRAALLDELVKYIPSHAVEFRKRFTECKDRGPNERLLLQFSDGTSAEADLSKCSPIYL